MKATHISMDPIRLANEQPVSECGTPSGNWGTYVLPTSELTGTQSAFIPVSPPTDLTSERLLRQRLLEVTMEMESQARGHRSFLWCTLPFLSIEALMALGQGDTWRCLFSSLALGACLTYRRKNSQADTERVAATLHIDTPEWIGLLINAWKLSVGATRAVVRCKLIEVLPQLRHEDAAWINAVQRDVLHRIVLYEVDEALASAVLKGLEKVGDHSTLLALEPFTTFTYSGSMESIRWSTVQSLRLIRERLRWEAEEQALISGQVPLVPPLPAQVSLDPQQIQQNKTEVERELLRLAEEGRVHRKPGMRLGFLAANWLVIVPYTACMAYGNFVDRHPFYGLFWTLICAATTQLHRVSLSLEQVEALRKLATRADKKGVGQFVEALEWPDEMCRRLANNALLKVLPELNASDTGLLNASQRAILHKLLDQRNIDLHEPLILAILRAFEQVGDKEALPFVQSLSEIQSNPRTDRVKRAAQDCLPLLQAVAEQNSYSRTLLRASSAMDASTETLLRPSTERVDTRGDQLLRPHLQDTQTTDDPAIS